MKKKIYFAIILILILLPLTTLAEEESYAPIIDLLQTDTSAAEQQESITLKMLELVWSAETYVPYGYLGKALPIQGSMVTIDAVLYTSGGNQSNLKFSWFLDNTFQEAKSGYGKKSFKFGVRRASGSTHNVLVKVFNEDRSFYTERTIEIPVAEPEVVLAPTNTNKLSIIAKPYFFEVSKLTDLVFRWTFEGQEPIISSNYNASILDIDILNKNSNQSIERNISISVKNSKKEQQNAYDSIKINL